jgi:DNA repair protein RadC
MKASSRKSRRPSVFGFEASDLSISQLIAVICRGGLDQGGEVTAQGRLKEYGDAAFIGGLDPTRLSETTGIPLPAACQVVASLELGRRYYGTGRAGRPPQVKTTKQAFQVLKDMGGLGTEQLRALYLNSRYEIVCDEVIAIGPLNGTTVRPREVFAPALRHGAAALVIAQNHPDGTVDPTIANMEVTEQMLAAGQTLGVQLLAHVIIAGDRYSTALHFSSRRRSPRTDDWGTHVYQDDDLA